MHLPELSGGLITVLVLPFSLHLSVLSVAHCVQKSSPKAVITIVAEQLGIDLAVLKINVTNGAKVVLLQPEWKKMDETFW